MAALTGKRDQGVCSVENSPFERRRFKFVADRCEAQMSPKVGYEVPVEGRTTNDQ
jgi:hypothetical protein